MGTVIQMLDHLRNALTGQGGNRDPRMQAAYVAVPHLTQAQIDAAYRSSGLLRKIVQIPALDMVREWRDWRLDAEHITAVEAEERRLGVQQKVRELEVLRGIGGGALILGLPGDPAGPAPVYPGRGALAFLTVVSRWQLTFDRIEDDYQQGVFGEPAMWRMRTDRGDIELHPSRVIPFRADTAATLIGQCSEEDRFWGESTIAQVLDAVKDSDTARASFAALLHKARCLRIGIPGLIEMAANPDGSQLLNERMSILAAAEGVHHAVVFDAGGPDGKGGETITDATYSFAGAKDILNVFAEFVAAVSDIPATRLLGRAPEGMNSSGDSQQRDWNKKVRARQTLELSPCIDRLDRYLVPSALGNTPDGCWYEWSPLDTPSEADEAARFKTFSEALEKVQGMGVVPDQVFAEAAQSVLVGNGWLPALEAALARVSEAERFGPANEPDTL
jgi:phage-related protein (TIGR01555 family)